MTKYKEDAKLVQVDDRSVSQFSEDGWYLRDWESISMASRCCGVAVNAIVKCCDGECSEAGGFIWEWNGR